MIEVRFVINSSIEEVIAFKCCHLFDQNLEILIKNTGHESIVFQNRLTLCNQTETLNYDFLYPPWHQTVNPFDIIAFYASMDPALWEKFNQAIIYDSCERQYKIDIKG